MKSIAVFGSTGSVGTQTLEVAEHLGVRVKALAAGRNDKLMEEQIRKFKPSIVAMADEAAAERLKIAVRDIDVEVLSGGNGIVQVAEQSDADIAVQAITGIAGLCPTIASIKRGADVALANKETLVCAGEIVMSLADSCGVRILPVDSEHSAIFQCLQDTHSAKSLEKILLTASGGPFFGKSFDELEGVTAADALHNPNWSMGAKITVDSATMMNKGLEFIEAMRLFNVSADKIEIVVHRESIIHSAVQFDDGAVIAQLSVPDMRLPIQYALTYPERKYSPMPRLDLAKLGTMTFYAPDETAFPCLKLAKKAAVNGKGMTAALNGANKAAVDLFLDGKIKFNDIYRLISSVLEKHNDVLNPTLEEIIEIDRLARQRVGELVR